MKTSTTAWAAALTVMFMNGPFTTAEAAPAQQLQQEAETERPKYYFPRHVKRAYPNVTSSKSNRLPSLLPGLTDNDDTTYFLNPQHSTASIPKPVKDDSTPAKSQTNPPSQLTTSITGSARVPADTSRTDNATRSALGSSTESSTTTSGLVDLLLNHTPSETPPSDETTSTIVLQDSATGTPTVSAEHPSANNSTTTKSLEYPASSSSTTNGGLLGSGHLLDTLLQPSKTRTTNEPSKGLPTNIVQPTGKSQTESGLTSEESAPYGTEFNPRTTGTGTINGGLLGSGRLLDTLLQPSKIRTTNEPSKGLPTNIVQPTGKSQTESGLTSEESAPYGTEFNPRTTGTGTINGGLLGSGRLLDTLLQPSKIRTTNEPSKGLPTNIVQPTGKSQTESGLTSEESAPYGTEFNPRTTGTGTSSILHTGTSGILHVEVSPTAPASTDASAKTPTSTSTRPLLVGLSTIIEHAESSPTPTTTTTSESGGLLDSLLAPLVPDPTTSSSFPQGTGYTSGSTGVDIVQPTGKSQTESGLTSKESATYGTEFSPQTTGTGTGGIPHVEVSPASTDASVKTPTSTRPLLVGLSTIIEHAESSPTPTTTTTSESGGLLDSLLAPLVPDPTTSSSFPQGTGYTSGSTTEAPVIVTTSSSFPQGTGYTSGATGEASVIVQSTPTSAPNTTTSETPGLLDPLITGLLPSPTESSISSVITSMSSQVSSASSTDALSDVASTLSSQLSSIIATNPAVSASLSSEFSTILSSAASSLASSTTGTAIVAGTETSTGLYSLSTSGASVVPTLPSTTVSSNGTAPIITPLTTDSTLTTSASSIETSLTSAAANSSATLVEPYTTSATLPISTESTASSTMSSEASSTEVISTPASTPATTGTTAEASTTTSAQSSISTSSHAPASIAPTGTDSATSMSIPSSIIFAPTSTQPTATLTSVPSDSSSTPSTSTGMPSAMPRLVQPPGGMPQSPANTTLIQVGFNHGLNFPFVVSTDNSATQIFTYLPQGIAYALGISKDKIVMNALMPYDTTKSLNFITTLAQAYIPSDMVSQLQLDLHTQMSRAYSNPDDPVHALMSMINPTIPILPGANMDQGYDAPSQNPAATATGSNGDGAPIGGDSSKSSSVNGTSVGIGLGAVAGAAVYAAAMVYVARRYRKKRASHKRASSVQGTGNMAERSPATLSGGMGGYFMSGANGARRGPSRQSSYGSGGRNSRQSNNSSNNRSVREQGISAPVSNGNSLGWD